MEHQVWPTVPSLYFNAGMRLFMDITLSTSTAVVSDVVAGDGRVAGTEQLQCALRRERLHVVQRRVPARLDQPPQQLCVFAFLGERLGVGGDRCGS